jgi:hypothetical protein
MEDEDIISILGKDATYQHYLHVDGKPIEGLHWYDIEGNITYSEEKVYSKKKAQYQQSKLILTQQDFEIVYEKARSQNPNGDIETFNEWIISRTQHGIDYHKQIRKLELHDLAYLSAAKAFIKWVSNQQPLKDESKDSFRSLFTPSGITAAFELLEEFEIYSQGKFNNESKGVDLAAVIVALKETPGIFRKDITKNAPLLRSFNAFLGSNLKEIDPRGDAYEEAHDQAKRHLRSFLG